MNICVSYNAGEFGDFIRYFCGLHTGQVKKEQIYLIKNKGISKVNKKNTYDTSKRGDVYIEITLV